MVKIVGKTMESFFSTRFYPVHFHLREMMRVHSLVWIPSLRTSLFCTHFVMPQGRQEKS